MPSDPPPAPPQQMMQMIGGFWITQIVHAAARYALADHLAREPMTAQAFADAEDLDHQAAARFLRACVGLGLVTRDGSRYGSTDLLDTLRKDHPRSLRGFALSQPAPGHWLPWGRFADALKTGERQTVATLGADIFDYYRTAPDEAAAFTDAMSGTTIASAAEVARLLDMSGFSCAVDVGGAAGAMLFAVLQANPHLKGIVFDLPNIIPTAQAAAEAAGVRDRVEIVGGDFFETIPEGDFYLLKYILHDWDNAACIRILRNCRRVARPGARIAVIEVLIETGGVVAPLMDLNMLVMSTGRERTLDEYRDLLVAGGFGDVTVTRTRTPMVILTATAV
ncbi:MAG: methyltransferase [Rhodospirillaceae bacterium]|nr:MAG: methyltransferase [Rhodospirillaceae bacterium]